MYFRHFGQVWWQAPDGQQILMNDITKFAGFQERYKTTPGFYLEYSIRDGERPEQISKRLYGDGRFAWTIIIFNGLCNYDEQWPRTSDELESYLAAKYPWQDYADVHHYVDEDGQICDPRALKIIHNLRSDADAIGTFGLRPVSIGDYEQEVNEAKRKIRLINANQINKVESDLKEQFGG